MNRRAASSGRESSERRSSLHQTRARYLQIIQDLTGDARAEGGPINQASSFSDGQRQSSTASEEQPAGYYSSHSHNSTPEEIKEFVRKFKLEVEEKFLNSTVNRNYRINPNAVDSKDSQQQSGGDSSLLSLEDAARYALASQNILLKHGKHGIDNHRGAVGGATFDVSTIVEMLHDIGKIDKEILKSQLKSKKSNILQAILDNFESKFIEEYEKKRGHFGKANSRRSGSNDCGESDIGGKVHNGHSNARQSSGGKIGIQNGNSEVEIRHLTAKESRRRRADTGSSIDIQAAKVRKRSSREEREITRSRGSPHDLRLNIQTETLATSKSIIHQNGAISSTKDSDRDVPRRSRQGKPFQSGNHGAVYIPTSPRTIARNGNAARKARNSITARSRQTTVNKTGYTPSKPVSGAMLQSGLYKRSNPNLFMNQALTTTLSPKSNLSLNTAKSNSKGKKKPALTANTLGGIKMSLSKQKLQPKQAGSTQMHLNVGSSQLMSKIKRTGDDHSKPRDQSSGQITKHKLAVKTNTAGQVQNSAKKRERGTLLSPTYTSGINSARLGQYASSHSRGRESSNDFNRKKKRVEVEALSGTGAAGTLHQILSLQGNSQPQNVHSLSNFNWRRRLENML